MKKYLFISTVSILIGIMGTWWVIRRARVQPETETAEKKIIMYRDPMHPWITSDRPGKAPDCGMDLVPVYEGESESGIQIDPAVVQNMGVRSEIVHRRKFSRVIRTVGKIQPNETKVFTFNSKISGWVEKLYVNYTGIPVHRGDPLMDIYSPDLVTAQQEYLSAIRYVQSLDSTDLPEVIKSANEMVNSARRRLLFWDISPEQITDLDKTGQVKKNMTIHSPYQGVMMEKMVYEGTKIMMGMDLFKIADLSDVWVMADIYEYELPWIQLNEPAEVELSYLPGQIFHGRVNYINPMVNMETRTVKVRIDLPNLKKDIELKMDMYARVSIQSTVSIDAILVPEQAIIRSGERNVAVVDAGNGYFDPREVKIGVTSDGWVQILEGIHEGEKIVTSSQFLIDSESNLKAAIDQLSARQNLSPKEPEQMEKTPLNGPENLRPGTKTYTCPMHPEVVSNKPGNCPKCGMALQEKKD